MGSTELIRRRMMGEEKEVDLYKNMIIVDFTISSVQTMLLTENDTSFYQRIVVDGVNIPISASMSIELTTGQHRVAWLLSDITTVAHLPTNTFEKNNYVLTIPGIVTHIPSYSLRDIPIGRLNRVNCYATTPPTVGSNPWLWDNNANGPLYVPKGTLSLYQSTSPWSSRLYIYEMD